MNADLLTRGLSPMRSAEMKLPGTIGQYRLDELLTDTLTAESSGDVYRATDTELNREVTVQFVRDAERETPGGGERFLERARKAAGLAHDNLVRTHDCGEASGEPYWVREWIDGCLLTEVLASGGLGDLEARIRVGADLARVIAHLHAHKAVNGNIKPDNIHIADADGRLRLLDFTAPADAKFIAGAPYYLAPEQLRGVPPGEATDLYSFGLVLFEVLSGTRARNTDAAGEVVRLAFEGEMDYEPLKRAKVPEALVALVQDATSAIIANRPPAMISIVNRLDRWLASGKDEPAQAVIVTPPAPRQLERKPAPAPPPPPPERVPPRRISFTRALVIGGLACILCGLLVGMLGVSVANARLTPRSAVKARVIP
jgi:eukaryotic-like serine/threonine-protein kinase